MNEDDLSQSSGSIAESPEMKLIEEIRIGERKSHDRRQAMKRELARYKSRVEELKLKLELELELQIHKSSLKSTSASSSSVSLIEFDVLIV